MRHPFLIAALAAMLALPGRARLRAVRQPGRAGAGQPGLGAGRGRKTKRTKTGATTKRLDLPGKKNAGPAPM